MTQALQAWLPVSLFMFIFGYPVAMSLVWMTGSVWFWFRVERHGSDPRRPPRLSRYPKVALVVPCFNEEDNVLEVLRNLNAQRYPNFEILAVNDGSTDRTGAVLDDLLTVYPRLRVVHLAANQGKAVALKAAAQLTDARLLLCIDGDALLDPDAARWMVRHFLANPRVAAVTGNPRLRTRSTLLGRMQVGEFSSIIGLIKRSQRTYGRIFTVSGVCVMFRRSALHDVGYWSTENLAEDIDISWRLQTHHWDVYFEPAATCWILMPETLRGLWRQRLRWATGGAQAIFHHAGIWRAWRRRRMWPVYAEYLVSVFWAYCMMLSFALFAATQLGAPLPANWQVHSLMPGWPGTVVALTCLAQTLLALAVDARYDVRLRRNLFWAVWYPLAYWALTAATAVVGLPRAVLRRGLRGRWTSPDRGLRETPHACG
jgi:biofilm PGA synthesis N-glycosyltransferase PgaC